MQLLKETDESDIIEVVNSRIWEDPLKISGIFLRDGNRILKIYVGITDYDWFMTLKQANCDEVNFWKPGGRTNFKALDEGDLFLFKLHSPQDFIVGGGLFLKFSILPASLSWEAFGVANGARSLFELNNRVYKYKKTNRLSDPDPQIGTKLCRDEITCDAAQRKRQNFIWYA